MSEPGRDLIRDLEICSKASEEPWTRTGNQSIPLVCGQPNKYGYQDSVLESLSWPNNNGKEPPTGDRVDVSEEDLLFMAEARQGWPHAIKRAQEAEAKLLLSRQREKHLEKLLMEVYDLYEDGTDCYEVDGDELGAYLGKAVHLSDDLERQILREVTEAELASKKEDEHE